MHSVDSKFVDPRQCRRGGALLRRRRPRVAEVLAVGIEGVELKDEAARVPVVIGFPVIDALEKPIALRPEIAEAVVRFLVGVWLLVEKPARTPDQLLQL